MHEVLEGLAEYKSEERFSKPLTHYFESAWKKVSGKKGGFISDDQESEVKTRALSMLARVERNPEPLLHKTVRVKSGDNGLPPNFYLSDEENIILCGKVDWLIWKPEDDSVHILDFKTGKNEESDGSLQLPIYQLLLKNLQKRKVTGASYWYLDKDDAPIEVDLPSVEESFEKVYKVASEVRNMRSRALVDGPEVFECHKGDAGCFACRPFEKILKGEAEYIGAGDMKQDLYMV